MPSKKILEQIVVAVIQAKEDAMPLVSWRRDSFHCDVRRYKDKLYLLDVSSFFYDEHKDSDHQNQVREYVLTEEHEIYLENSSTRIKLSSMNSNVSLQCLDRKTLLSQKITLRFRKGGERYRTKLEGHSRSLKHWFQEQSIPPWEREKIPLIYWGDELIQIGNSVVNSSLKVSCENANENSGSDDFLSILWQVIKNN